MVRRREQLVRRRGQLVRRRETVVRRREKMVRRREIVLWGHRTSHPIRSPGVREVVARAQDKQRSAQFILRLVLEYDTAYRYFEDCYIPRGRDLHALPITICRYTDAIESNLKSLACNCNTLHYRPCYSVWYASIFYYYVLSICISTEP